MTGDNSRAEKLIDAGHGQRVRRKVDGVETWQVYGMDGELLAEYAANAPSASPQKEYGYRNGQLLITAAGRTENVTWTNAVGVSVSGNSLTKTAVAAWGNAGASSTQALISGDGYVEFTASETSTSRMCGLSNGDSNQNYTDIDFAFYPTTSGSLQIYEGGVSRGVFGTYAVGDRLRVAVEGGVVKYRKNGTLLYTSGVNETYPLLVDTALYHTGSTIMNVVVSGNLSANGGTEVNWLVADQLGTPRIIIDKTGSLANVKRHDYLPFGEELYAGQGVRTTALGYTGDTIRQKFTQKERDIETNLDYFGARYYASTQGRFTSIDTGPFTPADPQNWNRYSYVQNNPLKFIDPTGRELKLLGDDAEYIKGELERLTGYKLNRDKETGVVTIDGSGRETKGTSENLADKLKEVIGLKDKDGNKVTVDIRVVRDTDGEGKSVFVDRFSSRSIDANDFKVIGKSAPELSASLLGHVLEEYAQAATTFRDMAGVGKVQELASHNAAVRVESQVLSDFTGKQEQQRRDFQGRSSVTFFYTSVQYDIATKSGAQIVSVTKKERQVRKAP